MEKPQPNELRARLRELLAIPDRDRSQYTVAYLNKGAGFEKGKSSPKIPIEVE